MHNIDRTTGEFGYEFSNESNQENFELNEMYETNPEFSGELGYEFSNEYQGEFENEYQGEFNQETISGETMEMELATELLGVTNEAELEQFLGKLISKVGRAAKGFIKSGPGRMITGALKKAAKSALPGLAGVVGTAFGGPVGGMIGSKLGGMASNLFELELEGLSNEDKEFEVARAYVRFANDATRRAIRNPRFRYQPRQVTRNAMVESAKRHAPGFLRRRRPVHGRPGGSRPVAPTNNNWGGAGDAGYGNGADTGAAGTSGTWYKEGNQIIINL